LDYHRREKARADTRYAVRRRKSHEFSQPLTADGLQTFREVFHSQKENAKASAYGQKYHCKFFHVMLSVLVAMVENTIVVWTKNG
jgi:hypothetical protein